MTSSDGHVLLDPDQHEAASAPEGPVLVEGGPGTGKSLVLAARAALLLLRQVSPKSIFRLTPNRLQVREIRGAFLAELRRVTERVSPEASEAVGVANIHGLADLWLRRLGPKAAGIPSDFTLWTHQQSEETMRQLLISQGLQVRIPREDVPDILRWHRLRRSGLPRVDVPGIPALWDELAALYDSEKRRQSALDPEDLILLAIRALEGSPNELRSCGNG